MNNQEVSTAYVGSTEIKECHLGSQLVLAPNGDALWYKANEVPTLDLRFAENESLVDATTGANLVDFTRASPATYVDSQGVIRNAVTNLLLRSEEFDNAYWTLGGGLLTPNATTAPDGTLTADLYTTTGAGQSIYPLAGTTVSPSTSYTFSVYVKLGTMAANNYKIAFYDVTNTAFIAIDVVPAQVPTTDAWTRVEYTLTTPAGCTNLRAYPFRSGPSIPSSTVYLWGAQLERSSTVGEYVPTTSTINSAPRFDHDPTTGESLGLLVEEQRTNSIRNNTMAGAVAGTPGTLPTNWVAGLAGGLSREVIGVGQANGISYIDLKISGTTTNTNLALNLGFEPVSGAASASGQTWTESIYLALVGGSLSGITDIKLFLSSTNGTSELGYFGLVDVSLTSSLTRFSGTGSPSTAGMTAVRPLLWIYQDGIGSAIDFTIRIGLPQLEQGAFATSVIPTDNTAPLGVTRAADVATDTTRGAALRSLFAQFRSPASGTRPIVSLDDNTANERIELFTSSTDPKLLVTDGGSAQADIDAGAITANTTARLAARFNTDNFAASVSGGAEVLDASGTLPTVDRIRIGSNQAGSYLNGHIARLAGWNEPLPVLPPITL